MDVMSRNVQVYFHTENDAERLKATLSKFTVSNIVIDQLEEADSKRLVVPNVPIQSGGANLPHSETGSYPIGYQEVDKDDKPRHAVISIEVAEDDLNDVLRAVKELDGHVDRSLFE